MRGSRSASRSLYVAEDMKAGEVITERNVRSVRPGFGLHPKYLKDIFGKEREPGFGERDEVCIGVREWLA